MGHRKHCISVSREELQDLFARLDEHGQVDSESLCVDIEGYGSFMLTVASAAAKTTNSLADAVLSIQTFVEQSAQQHIGILFDPEQPRQNDRSRLILISRCGCRTEQVVGSSMGRRERVSDSKTERISTHSGRRTWRISKENETATITAFKALLMLSIVTCSIVGFWFASSVFAKSRPHDPPHSWIAYDTKDSIGPKYQVAISAENASIWKSRTRDTESWTLRIDDQAIIPTRLLDEEERHYQTWYQINYPETNLIRLNEDFVNETWLGSDAANLVPIDELFHFSHCVLAVRRYIKAKEIGQHVCGRDIDHDHMKHCLDALDWWAFPDARAESFRNAERRLGWRTKACFD